MIALFNPDFTKHIFALFQTLLSCASKSTKSILGRIGVFTVTSFHALVAARTPLTAANMYSRQGSGGSGTGTTGSSKRRGGLLSTFKQDGQQKMRPRSPKPFSPQARSVISRGKVGCEGVSGFWGKLGLGEVGFGGDGPVT